MHQCCHKHHTDETTPVDGMRIKERVVKNRNDDGTKECVHEIYEEVVPMRLAKRVSRKMTEIPVEETVEQFAEDGSVDTTVKSISQDRLNLDHQPTTLESLGAELNALRTDIAQDNAVKAKPKRAFMKKAKARYAEPPVEQEIQVTTGSKGEVVVTTIAWAVFAIAAGLLTFMVIT